MTRGSTSGIKHRELADGRRQKKYDNNYIILIFNNNEKRIFSLFAFKRCCDNSYIIILVFYTIIFKNTFDIKREVFKKNVKCQMLHPRP